MFKNTRVSVIEQLFGSQSSAVGVIYALTIVLIARELGRHGLWWSWGHCAKQMKPRNDTRGSWCFMDDPDILVENSGPCIMSRAGCLAARAVVCWVVTRVFVRTVVRPRVLNNIGVRIPRCIPWARWVGRVIRGCLVRYGYCMAERSPSNPWLLAERQNLSRGVTSWSSHFGPRTDRPLYQFRILLAAFPPYDCYRRTIHPIRPVSSVYSDAFELEDIARQLLGSAYDNHTEAIRALESKRDTL